MSYCSDSHGDSQAREFEISTDLDPITCFFGVRSKLYFITLIYTYLYTFNTYYIRAQLLTDFLQINVIYYSLDKHFTFWGPNEYFWETILYNMVEPNFTDVLRLRVTLCLKNMFRLETVVRCLMEISHYCCVR